MLQQQQQQQQQQRGQRNPKRSRVHANGEDELPGGKRQDRKAAVKSGWWRRGLPGAADEVERELLEAVAILQSLQSSAPMPDEADDWCHEDMPESQKTGDARLDAAAPHVTRDAHDWSAAPAGEAAADKTFHATHALPDKTFATHGEADREQAVCLLELLLLLLLW